MTDLAPSAAPPTHLKLWTNGTSIFIEVPGRLGPYIFRRNYDHRTISDVLNLVGGCRVDYDYQDTIPASYIEVHKAPTLASSVLDTEVRRAQAKAIALRLGIKPR